MKTFKKILALLVLSSGVAFTACNSDENVAPTLAVTPNSSSPSAGSVVDFVIAANGQEGAVIKNLKIEELRDGSSGTVVLKDSAVSNSSVGYTYKYNVPAAASGKIDIIVTVMDDNDEKASVTTTLNIAGSGTIETVPVAIVGNQENAAIGSFYSTTNKRAYSVGEATNNPSTIDFVHFFGSANAATISSPDNTDDLDDFNVFQNFAGTPGRLATRFKVPTATFDFTNANFTGLTSAWGDASAGTETNKANQLAVGNTILFKTQSGKIGAIKVDMISGSATTSGTITFQLKVQK